jgi:hypothetical protein
MKNLRRGVPNGEGRRGIPLLDDDKKACTWSIYLIFCIVRYTGDLKLNFKKKEKEEKKERENRFS